MDELVEAHKKEYGEAPDVVAVAPGRFHLIGEHSWFFKDKTLSMAVNLPVYVAVSKRDDTNLRFRFVQLDDSKRGSLASLKFRKEDKWANAVKSVLSGFSSCGFDCPGMNFTIWSDILPSAGFGITSAIKIATVWCVKELCHFRCRRVDLLQVIERANRLYFGTQNIKADSFTPIYSKEGCVVLTDYSRNECEVLPFKFKGKTIILTDARVPRITTWNEGSLQQPENALLLGELRESRSNVPGGWRYEENESERNEVLSVVDEGTRRRLQCVIEEHRCVLDAYAGILGDDFSTFARAVKKSHENMRDLYDISCPEIDWILKRVQELDLNPDDLRNPVNCGRITGKGFGRCTYSVLRTEDVEGYKKKLADYERIFGFSPACYEVKPMRGVHLV
ncbi:MAG: galactokinase [Treponema sp.]|nr:galactokinase [Treponema sp.]